jgi:H+/Cl- antiporter ClcA
MGLASTLFIKSIYFFEDYFDLRIKGDYYFRQLLGMSLVGVLIYISMALFGHVDKRINRRLSFRQ